MDSCLVSPPPAEQAPGATSAVPSQSWISKSNLHMKALIKVLRSPIFLCFQGEKVGKIWGCWKFPQFLEKEPRLSPPPVCLTWARAEEARLGRGSRTDFFPSLTPAKRLTELGLSVASTVEAASTSPPLVSWSHAESWLCTSQPLTYLQVGYMRQRDA